MALRKIKGKYYSYYRTAPRRLPDGRIVPGKSVTRATGVDVETGNIDDAILLDRHNLESEHRLRYKFKLGMVTGAFPSVPRQTYPGAAPVQFDPQSAGTPASRLKLSDVLDAAATLRPVAKDSAQIFRRFVRAFPNRHLDEISPQMALTYLTGSLKDSGGHTWNNNLSALNAICKRVLLQAGLSESPFARIPRKERNSEPQRSFTELEIEKLLDAAPEPWKTALLISYYTGFRKKDCFTLCWSHIIKENDTMIISKIPEKTKRTKRAVKITIHPELWDNLSRIRHVQTDNRVLASLGCYHPRSRQYQTGFSELLSKCEIAADENETVNFNSMRNAFISRCIDAGIDIRLLQGTVGHTEAGQTLHYYDHAIPVDALPGMKKCAQTERSN